MCNLGNPERMIVVEPLAAPVPLPDQMPEPQPEPAYIEVQEPATREIVPA